MASPDKSQKRPLSNKKLLLTKWTAVSPQQREKHFLVSRVHDPQLPSDQTIPKNYVELEAVLTKRRYLLVWTDLKDAARWLQGWQ
jgi:tryptophan-rich hypothetical protein